MNVEIKNYPSARTLVAEICGDIDHHTAKYFRGEIDKAIRSHNPLTLSSTILSDFMIAQVSGLLWADTG